MVLNYNVIKDKFEKLKNVEGYIQHSSKELEIFNKDETLPNFDDLHQNNNFILEAHFFNSSTNESISIKQINDTYSYYSILLNSEDLKSENINIYQTKYSKNVRIVQIWEKIEDKNCDGLEVLTPTKQVFSGFEKGDDK